ncbi:MAG: PAS domain S-box protein [Nitrospiraceae bacterium]|nr:PAS domain S-box protein [Nitrospiraceae bacterium]
MAKTRIIYKHIVIFLVFASLIVVPLTFTVVKQVNKMIAEEESVHPPENADYTQPHREFSDKLVGQLVPFVFYILVLALMLSILFSRGMLISLKGLLRGSKLMKEGNLDIRLPVVSDDELGEVTRAFNEMAAALREKTLELKRKDTYVNVMVDPLWVVDGENRITDVNPAFTRMFGYTREEVMGASLYDFFDEKNAAVIRRQIEEKRERGISSIYEINMLSRDGIQIPLLISGSPIFEGDKMVGKIGIFKDFREQQELRNELQREKEYVETIMDSIEDQLFVIDKEYSIIRANKVAMMEAGGHVIGRFCHAVAHHMDKPCWTGGHECPAQTVFITGKNYRTTHQHAGPAGERRFHEIVASPIKDSSGNVLHVIELIRDVTERMKHEEEIFNKNRELVALNSIAGILSKSLRADEIFTKILDRMIEMLRMDGGGIFFIDDAKREMVCQYHRGISEEFVKMMGRIRLGEDVPGRVAVTGQVMTTSDLSKDQRIERSFVKHSGMKGYCCIPVRGKERVIGVFCLFSFRTHYFTSEEENILTSVGEMTGIALENIKLYEKMRELYEYQRSRREEEQAQILSLSTRLGSAIELKDVMGPVLELIRNIFSADFVWLLVRDQEGNFILRSASPENGKEGKLIYANTVSSIEGYSAERRVPTVVGDIRVEAKFYLASDIGNSQFQSVIAVPMHIGEKTVGVYSLYYLGTREFKEDELHFLKIIANILAVSIERSDFYLKAITEKGLSDTILQSVADGIITVDVNGRIISVNKAFEKMTGVTATAAVGMPICDVFRYSDDNIDFRFSLGECFDAALNGGRMSRETFLTSVFQSRNAVLISATPVLDAGGGVSGVVNLVRDISREKEIDRMKTEIIRSVSHEFRTPLSAIVGMTEMILEEDIDGKRAKKYLRTILSEGIRLSNMVSDLLSIARIESGKEILKMVNVDMKELLSGLSRSFSPLVEKKKAEIKYDVDAGRYVVGDEEKIKQVLTNLIGNSLMFSDEGCRVHVSVTDTEGGIVITVSDNGWGISEEDLSHLPERFYRGRHGQRIKGTGLGLSLCREIVKMHGGSMEIRSKPGAGTEVVLSLPRREMK